ncbi:capsule biosynthesis protein [Rhodovulum euryhalinum]|uniref:Capsular polysaccharide transport system permease protein n=1 Tax=Rhodovulum euryhalinum TaxID=35805 RepID=A0A4R2KSD0_9RHOB|nr:capsule biosynthesis protein [Rhodovulum euryhalinum]TCO73916.1 capsular polysaccharide transport system permease protein [Rhodovulum euryhalinum]
MTTKPKAKRFRIRRSETPGLRAGDPGARAGAPVEDGFGDAPFPTARPIAPQGQPHLPDARGQAPAGLATPATGPLSPDQEIDAIRREGLTGRQLRMARRVAQKHGLVPASDFDAVRLLRRQGIDPFQRANMLELVRSEASAGEGGAGQVQPPRTMPETTRNLPSARAGNGVPAGTAPPPRGESRMREVREIQIDIARRRRRAFALMMARLAAFVLLPTAIAGYYYFVIATPMFATKSEFVIQQADAQSGGGLGSLFQGTGLAMQQDSIAVQSYLQSRDAMLRLNEDLGFRSHFSQDFIDLVRRLPPEASNESAYKLYQKTVKIGYDSTEGILKMEVIAADPDTSAAFSEALISYAEERVDGLTQRLRGDQMAGARESYDTAEARVAEAQQKVLDLQEKLGVLDPASETSALMSQIATFEIQLREKRLALQQLLDNPRPSQARVDGVEGDIRRLEDLVTDLRSSMTESGRRGDSLARVSAELRIAEADLANRQLLLQQALQQMETARIEANRQVRYLSLGVSPVAPDEATYPRAFENTALAFLIFGGIYLMISLTVSILREQVSA